MTLSPLMPWLTSGSRFLGGSVKGQLHAWPFLLCGCVRAAGWRQGGPGVRQGAAMGMVLLESVPWEAALCIHLLRYDLISDSKSSETRL